MRDIKCIPLVSDPDGSIKQGKYLAFRTNRRTPHTGLNTRATRIRRQRRIERLHKAFAREVSLSEFVNHE